VLVILVGRDGLPIVGMFMLVIVGMRVGLIPVAVFMIVLDHLRRGRAALTSATFAHMSLLAPLAGC
jgi:hypothetical protein